MFRFYSIAVLLVITQGLSAQSIKSVHTVFVDSGWANNSVNTVIFRKNSLCTFKNTQYISYYNKDGVIVLGKRTIGTTQWLLQTTNFKGDVTDAHRSISIITDGDGYLHMSWNHHGNKLHYSKSIAAGSLQLTEELPMTGIAETNVTYPEFHCLPDGNILFLYRDGRSGQGNLVVDRYNTPQKKWEQLQSNLIDGEKQRNAYWQACVDTKGTIHLSWVWRESPDVASNHDMCYAQSTDGGITWSNSKNEKYTLPINATTAEYVCRIPQKSELINQTSMYADEDGHPFIASYWKDQGDSIPQYHVIYKTGAEWTIQNTGFRKTAFSLSGAGTKRIPVSRPQILSFKKGNTNAVILLFRDEERGSKVSVAINTDINVNKWQLKDVTAATVGSWEPTYDTELWKHKKHLNLFVQYTDQKDGEGKADILPQPVQVLEIKIK
ncbi:BNR repeat-containing protein [Ferruginibacter sp. SUN106]|uniref:BNR repeat-containing protein n=1 Tax=Ferruginibacter sp. SUN106 TaxID=2978348 RepID=UPI003D36A24F